MTDIDLLREALRHAGEHSASRSTHVGALILSGRRLVYAANACTAGDHIEHAERAAIYKAAACGVPTAGATMYAPWFACRECASAIVLAGIREVVGLQVLAGLTPERWRDQVDGGIRLLRAGGVGVRWVAEPVGLTVLFDGGAVQC